MSFGGFGGSATRGTASIAPNDFNVPTAGEDGVSSLVWSPTSNLLVSSNWDSQIRCWDVQQQGTQVQAQPKAAVKHENNSPALCTTFHPEGQIVFSGGCDKAVRMWNLGQQPPNGVPQQIGSHDAPVKGVGFLKSTNLVVSGGWDRKLKFWDARQPNPVAALDMPERVYDLDVCNELMVVATAARHIVVYNCQQQPREVERKESPLKHQTRCVSCFPDATGYAVGSIEGRVGIQYVTKVAGKDSFAFKCHRQDNNAYAVNGIAFNNAFGTFATVGADGVVNIWDKENKQRLKGFSAIQRTISCAAFSAQGNLFAYASSYDWSKGSQHVQPGNEIFVHSVPEEEVRPKGKKTGGYKR